MKKILSALFISILAAVAAYASPVDSKVAKNTAEAFLGKSNLSLVWAGDQTKAVADPQYYVFNSSSGGWVIIAGDDCCEPILAYSESGSFDASNIPSNFKFWMNGIGKNINAVRAAGLAPKASIKAKWYGGTKAATSQKLIETASWGQDSPFNDNCPSYKGQKCLSGCVATAMAITLRHNKYPAKGTGTIPAYTTLTNSISVSAITLGTAYDWDNMPLVYGSSATTAQKKAVATLMQHCGAMVEMDYDPDGSGAMSSCIVPGLTKYMGYSKAARELYRYDYSNTDWFKIIKGEIDADRVIIYGGSDSKTEDGHQFVLDGYDSNNMVHVNWGWTGSCNAWYAINYLGDKSDSGVNDVFSYCDGAVIGLAPESGPSTLNVELALESQAKDNIYGIWLSSGTIAKASTFAISLGFICNYNYDTAYSGAVKIGLYDRSGNLKEYVSSEKNISIKKATLSDSSISPGYTSVSNISCKITKDIALGDYLMAVYKLTDGSWAILGGYNSDEFADSKYEFYTLYKLGAIDLGYLNVADEVSAGQVIYFDLVGSHTLPSSIVWYWDGSKNTKRFVSATAGEHTLKAVVTGTDESTETIEKVIKVQ